MSLYRLTSRLFACAAVAIVSTVGATALANPMVAGSAAGLGAPATGGGGAAALVVLAVAFAAAAILTARMARR